MKFGSPTPFFFGVVFTLIFFLIQQNFARHHAIQKVCELKSAHDTCFNLLNR